MSLNGLDEPKVVEAHEAGAAEPGGWFLLKYASRDEVELLDRGNGGIVEIRNAIAGYEEESPLYGFLRYRRRNVIIKYLPEDCSRLIQARVAVHFNAVCERFSPYDTIFEITTASELRDTKLSAACSLHAASGSTSSSTSSLRRRRLMEIAEEDEEDQRATKRQSLVPETDGARPETPADKTPTADCVTLNSDLASSPEHSKFSAATTSDVPKFVGISNGPTSPARSVDTTDSRADLYSSYSSYPTSKPKVKLGPRPSFDASIRPQTAGNFRPVSSIPVGLKLFGKGQKKGRGKDGSAATSPQEEIAVMNFSNVSSTSVVLPQESLGISTDPARPATSTGVPITTITVPAPAPTKPTISREKARLMKAMQLREKKKLQAAAANAAPDADAPGADDEKATTEEVEEKVAETIEEEEEETEDNEVNDGVEEIEDTTDQNDEDDEENDSQLQAQPVEKKRLSLNQADSAVVLDTLSSSVHTDQTSDLTHSDSRAESPGAAPLEPDQSTAASSLSESTDETVQAKDQEDQEMERSKEGEFATATPPETEDKDELQPKEEAVSVVPEAEAAGLAPGTQEQQTRLEATETVDELATGSQLPQDDNNEAAVKTEAVSERDASMSTPAAPITTDLSKSLEADVSQDDSTDAWDDGKETKESVAVPISKFSAHVPTPPTAPQPGISGSMVSETSEIPTAGANDVAQATDQGESTSPRLMVPKSKFSTQDLAAATKAASQPVVATPLMEQENDAPTATTAVGTEETEPAVESAPEPAPEPTEQQPKRAPVVPPINTDIGEQSLTAVRAEANVSDDDDLMEELQSATVQEAKPMIVAKSPLTPVFPSPATANGPLSAAAAPQVHSAVRTVSNPVRGNLIVPTDVTQSSARSLSSGAAYLHKVTQQQAGGGSLATMKPNVGSSISQRIKALEMLSAGSGDQSRPASRERPSSTFFAVQKRETSRSPSVVDRTKSLKHTPPSPTPSQDSSPETSRVRRKRSGSVASRLSKFETSPGSTPSGLSPGTQFRGRPESVSVTAKIIRDPNQASGMEPPKDPSEYSYLDLKQSPLVVDHHKAIIMAISPERRSTSLERDNKDDKGRRPSLTTVKGFFGKEHRKSLTDSQQISTSRAPSRPSSSAHQNTSGHRVSMSKDRDNTLLPSAMTDGSVSGDDKSDKKMSRAGRFMRRLSNISGARGKTTTPPSFSPTLVEESRNMAAEPVKRPATTPSGPSTPSIVSDMGDVNVQFPDNLLWKRRNLCLDSQGFIILSALPAQSRLAQGTKRYHMSEFRQPYTPDVEVQELPNSVVLDFIEGAGIQLACEDRTGQLNVLQVLRDAHANHATFGQ